MNQDNTLNAMAEFTFSHTLKEEYYMKNGDQRARRTSTSSKRGALHKLSDGI